MSEFIWSQVADGVQRIEMRRPQKKNALTRAMYRALAESIEAAEQDPAVRVVLISGQQGIFTAGNELQDFLKLEDPAAGSIADAQRFMFAMIRASKPLIAAVSGYAIGIGTTLLLHCDLVYASAEARFQLPFVALAACPEFASSLLLPAICGYQQAAELLLFGEMFDAPRAQSLGLVNAVVPEAELMGLAEARALRLASLPPNAVRTTKQLLKRSLAPLIEQRIGEENGHFRALMRSPEAQEAVTALLEKRAPDFTRFR